MKRATQTAQLALWMRKEVNRRKALHRAQENKRPAWVIAKRRERLTVAVVRVNELHRWFEDHPDRRREIVKLMDWAIANTFRIHYAQTRPMHSLERWKHRLLPITADCSESTTGLAYAVGCPDPNGNGYDGTGYTGTLRSHSPEIRLRDARPGDFIVYGVAGGSHVVVIRRRRGLNPVVFSHGQEAGPLINDHQTQIATHGSHFTVHRMVGL